MITIGEFEMPALYGIWDCTGKRWLSSSGNDPIVNSDPRIIALRLAAMMNAYDCRVAFVPDDGGAPLKFYEPVVERK